MLDLPNRHELLPVSLPRILLRVERSVAVHLLCPRAARTRRWAGERIKVLTVDHPRGVEFAGKSGDWFRHPGRHKRLLGAVRHLALGAAARVRGNGALQTEAYAQETCK